MAGGGDYRREPGNWKKIFISMYSVIFAGVLASLLLVLSALHGSLNLSPLVLTYSSFAAVGQIGNAVVTNDSLSAMVADNSTSEMGVPSPEKTMPPLESFRLTKELVSERVKDNIIIVTFGNYAFKDFVRTWWKRLSELGLSNTLVGAMDDKLLKDLHWEGVPVFYMGSNMSEGDLGWGSSAFHKMGREKVALLNTLLPYGYEILFSDTDVVWLQNPLPYFSRYPDADILTTTDRLVPSAADDSLEVWNDVLASSSYNIGNFFWRPTNSSRRFLKSWIGMLEEDETIWDQNAFNDILRQKMGPSVAGGQGLVHAFDGELKLGILPSSIFCSGHTYFVQAMADQLKLRPYAVHTTFQYCGIDGKRHRLREAMLFVDPPEYYDAPGGFLSFNPSIPRKLLIDIRLDVESHFNLVNFQMKQIRTALAIAQVLGRTLVMPHLWCILDRFWYAHPGIYPGSFTRTPFLCPLDHVFEVQNMLRELPAEQFGPPIGIREYSFLDNPTLPKHVKDSWIDVQLVENGKQAPNLTASTKILRLPTNSTKTKLKRAFSPLKDVKVIRFLSMQNAFKGFTNKKEEERFRNRVKVYASSWCCMMNRDPGHIYYDMFWDEKPNWKPHPPESKEEDHPPW